MEQCDLLDAGKYKSRRRRLQFTHFQAASHARLDSVYTSVSLATYGIFIALIPVSFTHQCLVTVQLLNGFKNEKTIDWHHWKLND